MLYGTDSQHVSLARELELELEWCNAYAPSRAIQSSSAATVQECHSSAATVLGCHSTAATVLGCHSTTRFDGVSL